MFKILIAEDDLELRQLFRHVLLKNGYTVKGVSDGQEALDVLLTEVMDELTSVRPDILIEFRQRYIGPQIRKYGNLLRVSDCPGSGISNRVGIVDLRLLSGKTAVHSDMLMWHEAETAQDAALQVLSCIFSTVQISVSLDKLTEEMKKMLKIRII